MGPFGRLVSQARLMIVVPIASASVGVVVMAADLTKSFDAGRYWHQPLAAQGEPPKSWTKVEQSLAPADCGQCHAEQFAQWQTSRHAHSFSPGLLGQILAYDAADTAECLQCHAPLAEQRIAFEAARSLGVAALTEKDGLAVAGNSCGSCHVRAYHRLVLRSGARARSDRARLPRRTAACSERRTSNGPSSAVAVTNLRQNSPSTASRSKTLL